MALTQHFKYSMFWIFLVQFIFILMLWSFVIQPGYLKYISNGHVLNNTIDIISALRKQHNHSLYHLSHNMNALKESLTLLFFSYI